MSTTIQPLTNRILVRPKAPFDPQIPGFVIPESAQGDEPTEGEVVALGARRTPKGRSIEWDIQPGDQVNYRLYAGAPVHGTGLVIIKDTDLLGIVVDKEPQEAIKRRILALAAELEPDACPICTRATGT